MQELKTAFPPLPLSREALDSGWGISFLMMVRNCNRYTKESRKAFFKKQSIGKKFAEDKELTKKKFIKYNDRKCPLHCFVSMSFGLVKKGDYGYYDKEDEKVIFLVDGIQVAYYELSVQHIISIINSKIKLKNKTQILEPEKGVTTFCIENYNAEPQMSFHYE